MTSEAAPRGRCPHCGGMLWPDVDGDRRCLNCARTVYARPPLPKVKGEEKARVYWRQRKPRPPADG